MVNQAIAAKKLPGAVVLVNHDGKTVYEQAFGVREYAGEPGLDGKPSPAEPMTVGTIFDMASLTKCLATATAVMQLYEEHKIGLDDSVVKYLPEFGVNGKEKVTIRELLTHYSGLPEDVSLKDDWGLAKPDKAEGIRRAMESSLDSVPGTKFVYSDINYITLGTLVEKVSGETLDDYASEHIFKPLKMAHTRYLPITKACGPAGRGQKILRRPPIHAALMAGDDGIGFIRLRLRSMMIRGRRRRILIMTICCEGRCMTRRRGGWVELLGMREFFLRLAMLLCLHRLCWTGLREGLARFL